MIVINTPVSPYLQNAPIVYCDKTKKSIFVDQNQKKNSKPKVVHMVFLAQKNKF